MANQEQVEILKQGIEGWNKWMENNPDVDIDLSGANLNGADLRYANLSNANLSNANLRGADLFKADLSGADLRYADLIRYADLRYAKLRYADLRGADLRSADLRCADLRESDITGAMLYNTARDDWKVDGIKCYCIYFGFDYEGKERTPKDRDFIPGEFEKLYKWRPLNDFERLIERSIEFPPEYKQAGVSILNYFSEILRQKYPESEATVQIRQDGLKVTMTIDPVNGKREVIEKILNDYGMVITGKYGQLEEFGNKSCLTIPEEFFPDNPMQVLKLQNKLDVVTMELRQEKRIHELAEKQYGGRIQSLEEEVIWLRNTIGSAIQSRPVIPVTVSPVINVSHGDKIDINGDDVAIATGRAKAGIEK